MSSEIQVARDGIRIWAQALGADEAPSFLLLAGNGCSATYWPDAFCLPLVDAGFRVIRFDWRDTGASTHRPFDEHPYDVDDLAEDALAVADAFGAARIHLVGLSMGGFIAQRMAIDHPERAMSLTSMLSTSDYAVMLHTFCGGDPPTSRLPAPKKEWLDALGRLPPNLSLPELLVESWRLASGPRATFEPEYWRDLVESATRRGDDTLAGDAHRKASLRSTRKNLLPELAHAKVPALFLGGSEDPIFPPGHAEASANAMGAARSVILDGLGHALSPAYMARLVEEILAHVRSAAGQA
jgi:pimeloyl-ACP methyl ester carboxylesterase